MSIRVPCKRVNYALSVGGAFVKSYRVYCLDEALSIQSVDILDATNDAEAVSAATNLKPEFRREVWDRDRLIGRIDALLPSPSSGKTIS